MTPTTFFLNQRVIFLGKSTTPEDEGGVKEKGTIRYIGPLDGEDRSSQWIGVDWDNEMRGKHDGSHNGIRYFEAKHPKSGSFVRPKKLSRGVTLLEAVVNKYVSDLSSLKLDAEIHTTLGSVKPVISVGFDKVVNFQSDLSNLRKVIVDDCCVRDFEVDDDNLNDIFKNVHHLDISNNLLTTWSSVLRIVTSMPCLTTLEIAFNPGLRLDIDLDSISCGLEELSHLNIGHMLYDWPMINSIVSKLPKLRYLQIFDNQIFGIKSPLQPNSLVNLEILDIGYNNITDWSSISVFAVLPKLKTLQMSFCQISKVEIEDDELKSCSTFKALQTLYIQSNKLDNWNSFAFLSIYMPHLTNLRCTNNPIFTTVSVESGRQFVIASIPSLSELNGSRIDRTERLGSEYDFLKHESRLCRGELDKVNPAYARLVKLHGPPPEAEEGSGFTGGRGGTSLDSCISQSVISVRFVFNSKVVEKRLPLSMSVNKLRNVVVRKMFNFTIEEMHNLELLHYSHPKNFNGDDADKQSPFVILDNMQKTLALYDIKSETEIHISLSK